ncbi:hypothetical protein SASPL_135997 [Salvia splendens]|uniref:Uncharacterized protein n=1 Tax=Salvia splendens TaxID=180675 RepID=A0A8X8WZ50_SALSN|nr:hypothetical protein SASPL_135997 [Salvia splendens]
MSGTQRGLARFSIIKADAPARPPLRRRDDRVAPPPRRAVDHRRHQHRHRARGVRLQILRRRALPPSCPSAALQMPLHQVTLAAQPSPLEFPMNSFRHMPFVALLLQPTDGLAGDSH